MAIVKVLDHKNKPKNVTYVKLEINRKFFDAMFVLADVLKVHGLPSDYPVATLFATNDLDPVLIDGQSIICISTNGVLWIEHMTGVRLISAEPKAQHLFLSDEYSPFAVSERAMRKHEIEERHADDVLDNLMIKSRMLQMQRAQALTAVANIDISSLTSDNAQVVSDLRRLLNKEWEELELECQADEIEDCLDDASEGISPSARL